MTDIGRREFLVGGGALSGGLLISSYSTGIGGTEFLENIDKTAAGNRAILISEKIDRSEDVLSEIELPLPQNLEAYSYRPGNKHTEGPITEKGVKVTPDFYLSLYRGDVLQGQIDGESFEYHYLEGIDLEEVVLSDAKQLLDVTGDGYQDIILTGDEETGQLGKLNNRLEEFNNIRPFIRVKDNRPFLDQRSIGQLEGLIRDAEASITDAAEFLNSYEGSPAQISESASDLINELERSDTSTYRNIRFFGPVTGSDYHPEDRFTTEEAENLIDGEGQYEDFGLEQTKEQADGLLVGSSLRTGKARIIQQLLESTLEFAERNAEIYREPDRENSSSNGDSESQSNEPDSDESDDIDVDYTDILDEESESMVENYLADAEFELGNLDSERIRMYEEGGSYSIGLTDYDYSLRLTEENSFTQDEVNLLLEYEEHLDEIFRDAV